MAMRGASAEAMSDLAEKLDQVIGSADAGKVGDDLFAVAAVLRAEPGLRRIATDMSTDADAKAELVRSIFGDKIEAASLDLVTDAVRRRWTSTRDLADTLEHLGVIAVVRSASSKDATRLSDELFTVAELVDGSPELREALSDPLRTTEDKRRLLRGLLESHALPATVKLAEQALSGSYRSPGVAMAEYQKAAAAVHDERVAKVRVAQELTPAEQDRLQQALAAQYGRDIHLDVVVEPELIGGMRVEIGDDVIDGTVSGRIDDARRRLVG